MDHSVNGDSCTVFHFGRRPIKVEVRGAVSILWYWVRLHGEPRTLHLHVAHLRPRSMFSVEIAMD